MSRAVYRPLFLFFIKAASVSAAFLFPAATACGQESLTLDANAGSRAEGRGQALFKKIDKNGDGCIDFLEYSQLKFKSKNGSDGAVTISTKRLQFQKIDADKDGVLSLEEYKSHIQRSKIYLKSKG